MINISIKDIINKWDPIDLFPYAPDDEYEEEIDLLQEFITSNQEKVEETVLSSEIHKVFTRKFGDDVFKKDMKECLDIARKIIILKS